MKFIFRNFLLRMDVVIRSGAKIFGSSSKEELLNAVLAERPDLCSVPVSFPPQGMVGCTVRIGDEIFKTPLVKGEGLFSSFNKDIENLQRLQGAGLSVVPRLTCLGKHFPFYGMTRMPGVPLSDSLPNMTGQEKENLAKDVASFIADVAETLPARSGKYARHADLRPDNIFVDPATKKLTAVIDYGVFEYCAKEDLGRFSLRIKAHYAGSGFCKMMTAAYEALSQEDSPKERRWQVGDSAPTRCEDAGGQKNPCRPASFDPRSRLPLRPISGFGF